MKASVLMARVDRAGGESSGDGGIVAVTSSCRLASLRKPRRFLAQDATSPGRGASVQSAGGPRLKGRPVAAVATSAGKSAAATCWPAKHGMAATASGGKAHPSAPHRSQCEPGRGASPEPESEPMPEAALRLQMPPNWPVRTSSASMDTGASKADNTARKLRKAARRAHTARDGRITQG